MADDKGDDHPIARRNFLLGAGTAVAAGLAPATPADAATTGANPATTAAPQAGEPPGFLTLTPTEIAFLTAVADTMIPADNLSPSGTDCGVVTFIDRQLAGAWGAGAKMYRQGPFRNAKAEYGYQLALTPRQWFAAGISAINEWSRQSYGKDFDRLSPQQREAALKELDGGKATLNEIDGKRFFDAMLEIVMEGYFADPIYGGNRNKAGWRMIGYPGLPAVYTNLIDEYRNKRYVVEPQSIQDFS
jgi:gluconate 2-dehydrogenase gamma chain